MSLGPGHNVTEFDNVAAAATLIIGPTPTGLGVNDKKATYLNTRLLVTAGTAADRTLDVKIQISDDEDNWTDLPNAAFTQIVAATELPTQQYKIHLPLAGAILRALCTIGGTDPTWDFKVDFKIIES